MPPDFEPVTGEHFDKTMGLVLDRLEAVEGRQMTPDQLQAAFAAGMRAALTDQAVIDDVMSKVAVAAQRRVAERTGNAVGSIIKSLLTRWLIIGAVLLMVAKTAGIDVAAKVWAGIKAAL